MGKIKDCIDLKKKYYREIEAKYQDKSSYTNVNKILGMEFIKETIRELYNSNPIDVFAQELDKLVNSNIIMRVEVAHMILLNLKMFKPEDIADVFSVLRNWLNHDITGKRYIYHDEYLPIFFSIGLIDEDLLPIALERRYIRLRTLCQFYQSSSDSDLFDKFIIRDIENISFELAVLLLKITNDDIDYCKDTTFCEILFQMLHDNGDIAAELILEYNRYWVLKVPFIDAELNLEQIQELAKKKPLIMLRHLTSDSSSHYITDSLITIFKEKLKPSTFLKYCNLSYNKLRFGEHFMLSKEKAKEISEYLRVCKLYKELR